MLFIRLIGDSLSAKKIIILDCCFSGAAGDMFTKGGGLVIAKSGKKPEEPLTKIQNDDLIV